MAGEQKFTAFNAGESPGDTNSPGDARPDASLAPADDSQQADVAEYGAEPDALPARWSWILPVVAGLALIAWTGFFIWANFWAMDSAIDPANLPGQISTWVSTWATPVLLIGVIWLIVMRSSRRETGRFANTARLLTIESERLERRLLTINRELSLAREFVSAQARDLDSVGRIAVDRLSQHADRLQTLVQENSAQVEAIGTVSAAALENMERLRGQLPVLTSAAKDVTNNLGNAGRTANAQLQELIAGFDRLVQSGQVSENLVVSLRGQFDQTMDSFTARTFELDRSFAARVQAMTGQADSFRAALLTHQAEFEAQLRNRFAALTNETAETRSLLDREEAESIISLRSRLTALRDETSAVARALREGEGAALANWREAVTRLDTYINAANEAAADIDRQTAATSNGRMAKLAEEAAALERVLSETGARFESETARRRHAAEAQDRGMAERLAATLAALDAEITQRETTYRAHLSALADQGEATTAQLTKIENRIAAIAASNAAADAGMTGRLDVLGTRLGEGRQLLDATDQTLAALTENAGRLLELIQSAATHSGENLVQAIDTGAARLANIEHRATALRDTVEDADRSGQSLSTYLLLAQNRLGEAAGDLAAWHEDIRVKAASHAQTLDELRQSLALLDSQTEVAAARVQGELAAAIRQLDDEGGAAVERIEQRGAASISSLANQLGEESGEAIERAMRLQVAEISGKLEQAAARAAGISREAASQLREQLAKVNDLVGNMETRVDQARARAEERVDDDFARRVALITEALNSNAIDIAKALDTDVSDTAWSAYLRGDRGIFTRRAVRLLDPPEARGIMQLYQNDRDFREYVSHYIHDFEGMLRQLLSTRDGHALGVTLLSSDMGKLYVLLAQAIERLRN
ncbi:MAG: ATPase [Pseudomonadota bacterium]|nr:ATPase [Pseudomonadota bacterium]